MSNVTVTGAAPTGTVVSAVLRESGVSGSTFSTSTTAASNAWSLSLPANTGRQYYVLSIRISGDPVDHNIIVVPAGGPYTVDQVISTRPEWPDWVTQSVLNVQSGRVTTGDHTLTAHAGWTVLPVMFEVTAKVGDTVTAFVSAMISWQSLGSDYITLAAVSDTTITLFADTGTSSPSASGEGLPWLYPNPGGFRTAGGPVTFDVTEDMVTDGKVAIAFAGKGSGGAKVFASAEYPMTWTAIVT